MNRLKELLKEFNIKQKQCPELLNISRDVISNMIIGRKIIDSDTLIKLSSLLKVSSDYLLGLSDEGIYVDVLGETYSISKVQLDSYRLSGKISYCNYVRVLNVNSISEIEFVKSKAQLIKLK